MLELRPSCEHCDVELPPESTRAMICSFECTYCESCAVDLFENVCPNCGGGLCKRPNRPNADLKNGNNLESYPASIKKVHKPKNVSEHQAFAESIKSIPPQQR